MASKKLWGGRFSAESHALFTAFNDSLSFDCELVETDIRGSIGYARALERAGIFTKKERATVECALQRLLQEHREHPQRIRQSKAEDVHTYVEQELEKKVGALALKLHTGRSRNDQVATDLRIYARERSVQIEAELILLLRGIADKAETSMGTLLPGYTHLQRAQPVLFSHLLLAYGEMFLRDRQRFQEARNRGNISPLGSGALSGTVYAIDRERLAGELGFDSIAHNSMDAVSDRDFALDLLYCASTTAIHLSRMAEDFILYSSSEFGFVVQHDSVSSGSSLMPQKKNPDALELIRGKTGRVFGHLLGLMTVLKGLPMSYNKDLQEDKEGLFDSVRTTLDCLRMIRLVLEKMEIRPDRMLAATRHGFLNATELSDYLVLKDMPFRRAHELVGRIVRRAMELDLTLEELPMEEYHRFSNLFRRDLYKTLDPSVSINRRSQPGGTALAQVRRSLKSFRKRLNG